MEFFQHRDLAGKHAFLGASKYHWLNYDDEKLISVFLNSMAAQEGTETHEFAAKCIERGQKLPRSKNTLNQYVNDCIKHGLSPEVILYYSPVCFGTADAINYNDRSRTLLIFDLKTGLTPAHIEQLEIYAALFCLEYGVNPFDISDFVLRIYQNDTFLEEHPSGETIADIMDKIIRFNELIEEQYTN